MIAIVVAMIVLQNADPTPVTTPAATTIGQRLTGSAPTSALQGLDTTSPLGDVSVTVGCTYGAPRLGPSLISDANDLSRTALMPNCTDPAGQSLVSPFAYAYPALVSLGRPASLVSTSLPNFAAAVPAHTVNTYSMEPRAPRTFAIQHLVLPTEFSAGAGSTASQLHVTPNAARPATTTTAHRIAPPAGRDL